MEPQQINSSIYFTPFLPPYYLWNPFEQMIVQPMVKEEQPQQSYSVFRQKNTKNTQIKEEMMSIPEMLPKAVLEKVKPCVTINKRKKPLNEEKDYKPYERSAKRKEVQMDSNRNILPTKIKQMLSFLGKDASDRHLVKAFLKRFNRKQNINQKRYLAFIKVKKQKIGNYVKLEILTQYLKIQANLEPLFSRDEQYFYLKLVKVLMNYYLRHIASLCTLNSSRINSAQKPEHLKVQRFLIDHVRGLNISTQ